MDIRGRGLKVSSGYNEIPELGNGVPWQISAFSWDRQARLRGQWRFKMTLDYIWDASKNEIQLYANGIGSDIPSEAKFSATIGIGNSGYNSAYLINDVKIEATIQAINTATFVTMDKTYEKENLIHIYCSTDKSNAVFFGIVNDARYIDGLWHYDCIEIGELLNRVAVTKTEGGLFKPRIMIRNKFDDGTDRPLSSFVSNIMKFYSKNPLYNFNNFGYGVDKTGYGKSTTLPGKSTKIPTQILSGMTVFKAVNRVLEDQCGLRTWYHNNTGALEYGYWRNVYQIDVSKDIIISNTETYGYTEDFVPANVIVFDSKGRHGCFPTIPVTGSWIKYRYESDLNDTTLSTLASQIHTDLSVSDRRVYRVQFPPGCVKMREGDKFSGLGDATLTPVMPFRNGNDTNPLVDPSDTSWQIKEMTITEKSTEVIVGPSYYGVFDLYKDALHKIGESATPTDYKEFTTAQSVVR